MKKNISINISGIIFHIEEDGYDELKQYLDSIHRYFSSFDDSSEILADIESRIAEIFLSRLSEEKQVITREDVHALMATMGSVSDFRAEEETREEQREQSDSSTGWASTLTPPKKLWRDQRRKILGGVCAGLGNYFEIDPLWFRLIFAALLPAGGFIILVYIILWIVLPPSYELEDPVKGKKMFRDPQTKVLGGVSGGVAAYLGIDIIIVRVLFIALTFAGGFGILLYILLWVILPEAVTLTDRMQMQGEPVTLSNIESTIKRKLNIREGETESTLSTIILFPFRLIGAVLNALAKVIGPLSEAVRVIAGIVLVLIGFFLVLSVLITVGVGLGLFVGGNAPTWLPGLAEADLPWSAFSRTLPGWLILAGVFAAIIPSLFVVLAGASILARRVVFQGVLGWTMLALFIASVGALAIGIPGIAYAFHAEGSYQEESVYTIDDKTILLRLSGSSDNYGGISLRLRGHDQPTIRLVKTFEARGGSPAQAEQNARMVEYGPVQLTDSVLTFTSDLRFKQDAVFRAQHLTMYLYLPYDHPFVMERKFSRFISQYVDERYVDGYTWKMTRDGLECITCESGDGEFSLQHIRDFNAVKLTGRFDVRIVQSDHYNVEWRNSNRASSLYNLEQQGETLVIDYKQNNNFEWDWDELEENWEMAIEKIELTITTPELTSVEANGIGTIRLDHLSVGRLNIETRGPVRVKGELRADDLNLRLTGRSKATLAGEVQDLQAQVEFASKLSGADLIAQNAYVRALGGSRATVNVTGTLEKNEGIASRISYRGDPQVVLDR